MSAEDRLRNLLRNEADTITPAGDGLTRIQERIARRRRTRRWLVPSAAIATGALAAAIFLIAPNDDHKDVLQPAGTPSATQSVEPSAQPTPSVEPSASPTVAPPPSDSYTGPAIWPYTSQAQADTWTMTSRPWAESGLAVTQHFVTDFLGLTGVTVTQSCLSCEVVGLEVAGKSVGQVAVAHYTLAGGTRVFTVVNVGGTDLTVTDPKAGAAIGSPTDVTGRIVGVDENVALRLLATDGRELASAGAPAGSAVPWQATLTWTARDWSTGGIVGVTRSARDGSVSRIVAVPVTRG